MVERHVESFDGYKLDGVVNLPIVTLLSGALFSGPTALGRGFSV